MATKKVTTKAPSGLTVTRNGNKFTFSWKIGDKDYGKGQQIQYHLGPTHKKGKYYPLSGTSSDIGKTTTSKSMTIDMSKYYPYTKTVLNDIYYHVRGCRANYAVTSGSGKKKTTTNYNPQWSAWTWKSLVFAVPNMPSMSTAWSADYNNRCTFTWSTVTSTDGTKHFANVELQSIRVKECNVTDGSKLSWKSSTDGWATASYGANSSRTFTEDTVLLANNSYTRWVRVRSRGCKGASAWRYAKHVYSKPYRAIVKKATATATAGRGYNCNIEWEAPANAAHPIDQTTVEYTIDTPVAGFKCPGGASWTEAETSADTGGKDKANFEIDDRVDFDQCVWLRVNTQHDDNINHGVPQRVAVGRLTDPEDISANIPTSGYKATISATNKSSVPDSFLVVLYRRIDPKTNKWETNPMVVGIIPPGSTSTSVTCPNWSGENKFSFGVYAAQGTYQKVTRADSVTQYRVTENTRSTKTIWTKENVPKAPETVTLSETSTNGTIMVAWSWSWASANAAEISWSDDANAWQSTAGYNSYKVDGKATKWYIPGLEMGKKWYVRVRLLEDDEVSPWSTRVTIDLATTPTTPSLTLSAGRIARSGSFTASWTYDSRDGTGQTYAEIATCNINGSTITNIKTIARTETSQAIILYPTTLRWSAGTAYNLRVRVTSESGKKSAWSDPVTINVATPLTCTISETSLKDVEVPDDEEEGTTRKVTALTELPMSLNVTGAGEGGTVAVSIERRESYHMDRPDETVFNGFEGEAVCVKTQSGDGAITIQKEDIYGRLDDGAKYRLVAVISDGLGQSARATLNFEVHWSHQAVIPTANVEVDYDNLVTKITPIAPAGFLAGDVCDIYRLSADKPELVVEDGTFGVTYVDPYPTLGEHGGHRVVFKTKNDDYITEDNQPAWVDYGENEDNILEVDDVIIDFDGERAVLPHNIALSSQWKKDFIETQYLGGSVQGDWNMGISRSGSVNTSTVIIDNQELIKTMRKLAAYPGICHVRTPEGSSYAADVQVSESMSYEKAGKIAEFSLSVTRVDAEEPDGMRLEEWEVGI